MKEEMEKVLTQAHDNIDRYSKEVIKYVSDQYAYYARGEDADYEMLNEAYDDFRDGATYWNYIMTQKIHEFIKHMCSNNIISCHSEEQIIQLFNDLKNN